MHIIMYTPRRTYYYNSCNIILSSYGSQVPTTRRFPFLLTFHLTMYRTLYTVHGMHSCYVNILYVSRIPVVDNASTVNSDNCLINH